jgi:hypothetical protein
MSFKLEKVVPWGRSMDEYIKMFNLTASKRACKRLDCASDPSSFNVEMTCLGYDVTACDPTYPFSTDDIQNRAVITDY